MISEPRMINMSLRFGLRKVGLLIFSHGNLHYLLSYSLALYLILIDYLSIIGSSIRDVTKMLALNEDIRVFVHQYSQTYRGLLRV